MRVIWGSPFVSPTASERTGHLWRRKCWCVWSRPRYSTRSWSLARKLHRTVVFWKCERSLKLRDRIISRSLCARLTHSPTQVGFFQTFFFSLRPYLSQKISSIFFIFQKNLKISNFNLNFFNWCFFNVSGAAYLFTDAKGAVSEVDSLIMMLNPPQASSQSKTSKTLGQIIYKFGLFRDWVVSLKKSKVMTTFLILEKIKTSSWKTGARFGVRCLNSCFRSKTQIGLIFEVIHKWVGVVDWLIDWLPAHWIMVISSPVVVRLSWLPPGSVFVVALVRGFHPSPLSTE